MSLLEFGSDIFVPTDEHPTSVEAHFFGAMPWRSAYEKLLFNLGAIGTEVSTQKFLTQMGDPPQTYILEARHSFVFPAQPELPTFYEETSAEIQVVELDYSELAVVGTVSVSYSDADTRVEGAVATKVPDACTEASRIKEAIELFRGVLAGITNSKT